MGRLNQQNKLRAVALRVAGVPQTEIARRLGTSRRTIHTLLKREFGDDIGKVNAQARMSRIRSKSLRAIKEALDCRDSAYRRGLLAVQYLKLTGALAEQPRLEPELQPARDEQGQKLC